MKSKAGFTCRVLCILAFAVLAGTQPVEATEPPTKIRFGNTAGIAFPTIIIAEEKGLLKKENLELETVSVAGSGAIAEALASNNIDIGNAAPTTAILAMAKGAKMKLVSAFEYTFVDKSGHQWEATLVAVRQGEGIKTLKDLRGKRIAVNDIGSIYTYMLRDQFKQLGMDPKKDLVLVPIPFNQMAGALIQKQVDAAVAISDAIYQMRERIPVDIIGSHTSLEGSDISLTSTIGVSAELLSKKPEVVVRFLRALLQARQWMSKAVADNNPELLEIVARTMKYSPERAKIFWESRGGYYGKETPFVNSLDFPERLVKRQVEILESAELLPASKSYAYADFVDISYLRKAYDSLGMTWDAAKH